MPKQIRHDVPLPPEVVLERLTDATVPFGIFRDVLRTPIKSGIELYSQSFVGPKKLMMKVDGSHFRLMNIGLMWPMNKLAATFRLGAVEGTVHESTHGSIIRARYKPLALSLISLLGFGLVAVVFTSVSLFLLANGLDGGGVFLAASGCWDFMVIVVFIVAYFGGRAEARFIKNCLDELVASMVAEPTTSDSDLAG